MKAFLVLVFVGISLTGFSQVRLFEPVPKDYFTPTADRSLKSLSTLWTPRLNVGLNAVSYGRNPETKLLEVTPLSAICFGIGMQHYKNVDGVPFNDFGFNAVYLQLTDKAGSGVGLYGTYNTGQIGLLNLGGHYDFAVGQFFFDTGISWHF